MKYVKMIAVVLAALLLCACTGEVAPTDAPETTQPVQTTGVPIAQEQQDAQRLNFPNLQWGMTTEEVRQVLRLEEDAYPLRSEQTKQYITGLRGRIFAGERAHVSFTFEDPDADGTFNLTAVQIVYPQATDMEAVKQALTASYGAPAREEAHEVRWDSLDTLRERLPEDTEGMQESVLRTPAATLSWTTQGYPVRVLDGENTENVVLFTLTPLPQTEQ